MSKRFLLFEDDEVLVDYDEIVRVDALTQGQIEAFERNGRAYKTVIFLRSAGGGAVHLSTPFAEVAATIREAAEVTS